MSMVKHRLTLPPHSGWRRVGGSKGHELVDYKLEKIRRVVIIT